MYLKICPKQPTKVQIEIGAVASLPFLPRSGDQPHIGAEADKGHASKPTRTFFNRQRRSSRTRALVSLQRDAWHCIPSNPLWPKARDARTAYCDREPGNLPTTMNMRLILWQPPCARDILRPKIVQAHRIRYPCPRAQGWKSSTPPCCATT